MTTKNRGYMKSRFLLCSIIVLLGSCSKPLAHTNEMELFQACLYGNIDTVDNLIKDNIDVNAELNQDEKRAFAKEYIKIMEVTFNGSENEIEYAKNFDMSPLSVATASGNFDIVGLLISANANVNHSDTRTGRTPLLYAALENHTDMVDYLLENNADVNAKDKYDQNALVFAINNNNYEIVEMLLKAGINVDEKYGDNQATPLMLSVTLNNSDITNLLVDYGANVNDEGVHGRTALIQAIISGNKTMIDFLINKGAIISSNTNIGIASGNIHLSDKAQSLFFDYYEILNASNKYSNYPENSLRTATLLGKSTKFKFKADYQETYKSLVFFNWYDENGGWRERDYCTFSDNAAKELVNIRYQRYNNTYWFFGYLKDRVFYLEHLEGPIKRYEN